MRSFFIIIMTADLQCLLTCKSKIVQHRFYSKLYFVVSLCFISVNRGLPNSKRHRMRLFLLFNSL